MRNFPGGIASADGKVGVLHLAGQELVAIELSSGDVLWRETSEGRPVAATGRHLVVLQPQGGAIDIRDLRTGRLRLSVADGPMWDWARDLWNRPEALYVLAEETGETLVVSLQAAPRYLGGAAPKAGPSETVAAKIRIDLASGQHQSWAVAPLGAEELVTAEPPVTGAGPQPSLPGEVSRERVEGTDYVLRVQSGPAGAQQVKLDALGPGNGDVLWEADLGDVQRAGRPGPLRK